MPQNKKYFVVYFHFYFKNDMIEYITSKQQKIRHQDRQQGLTSDETAMLQKTALWKGSFQGVFFVSYTAKTLRGIRTRAKM